MQFEMDSYTLWGREDGVMIAGSWLVALALLMYTLVGRWHVMMVGDWSTEKERDDVCSVLLSSVCFTVYCEIQLCECLRTILFFR